MKAKSIIVAAIFAGLFSGQLFAQVDTTGKKQKTDTSWKKERSDTSWKKDKKDTSLNKAMLINRDEQGSVISAVASREAVMVARLEDLNAWKRKNAWVITVRKEETEA